MVNKREKSSVTVFYCCSSTMTRRKRPAVYNQELRDDAFQGGTKSTKATLKRKRHHPRGDGAKQRKHSCCVQVGVHVMLVLKAKPTCPAVMNGSCQDQPNKQICTVHDNPPAGATVNNGTSLQAVLEKLHRSGRTHLLEIFSCLFFLHLDVWMTEQINGKTSESIVFGKKHFSMNRSKEVLSTYNLIYLGCCTVASVVGMYQNHNENYRNHQF